MNSRERLLSIFRGGVPDRPAVRLWSARPGQELLHPAYEPVRDAAVATTDLVVSAGSRFNVHWGAEKPPTGTEERPGPSAEWVDQVTTIDTPAGRLRSVYRAGVDGRPGYQVEHLVKEPADLKCLLSVPYAPFPFDAADFEKSEALLGDRGITMFGLDHPMYALERLIGSQNFALWSRDCREDLLEVVAVYADRILEHAKQALHAGIRGVFGWVGPELCIPPLMSPADFDAFVMPYDRALCGAIHEAGGRVWVHCHGRMGPVLERFVEMGVDVLNPIEPPPLGDLTLAEAFARVGDRMGLEGNLETHDLMTLPADRVRALVAEALAAGRGRRFILCPTSGYMETPQPTLRFIENLLTYVTEGVRLAEALAARA